MVSRWRRASAAALLAAIVTAFALVSIVAAGAATVARLAGLSPERTTVLILGLAALGSLAAGAHVFRREYRRDPPVPPTL